MIYLIIFLSIVSLVIAIELGLSNKALVFYLVSFLSGNFLIGMSKSSLEYPIEVKLMIVLAIIVVVTVGIYYIVADRK